MRIAAHLGVKDEAGLIGPCIAHLRAIGVDEFIVHDIASRDGTREALRREEGDGFRVVDVRDDDSEAHLNDSIHDAVAGCRADWVLKLDADEFPLPRGGDLRAALARRPEHVVEMPRYNVALGPDGPRLPLPPRPDAYGAIDLYAQADPDIRAKLEADGALAWIRAVPHPKVAVRPAHLGRLKDGGHSVKPKAGAQRSVCSADDIVVAHLALSDFGRFEAKVANIRSTLGQIEGQVAPNFGWHWRRWIAIDAAGGLRSEWERSVLTSDELAGLRAQGVLRTAADLLGCG